MKVITNILLIAALIVYIFLPVFKIEFIGNITGFQYTADTITDSTFLCKKLFAMLPFISCFGAIGFNCMKNRRWGYIVALFTGIGIAFYLLAKNYFMIEHPQIYTLEGIAYGFTVAYITLIFAFTSAILSLMPFNFNLLHELEKMRFSPIGKHFHKHNKKEE